MSFTLAAGLTDGFRDAFSYRCDNCNSFFNGKNSWLNKYKHRNISEGPAYFGSTTFLVFTTDGPHLSNAITHQFQGMALAYMPEDKNKKFFHILLRVASYNVIREAGHSLIYSIIFKP